MDDQTDQTPSSLSPAETLKGLRMFLYTAPFWSTYGQVATVSGAIFTGFALWLGFRESQIASLVSLVSLVGVIQLFASYLATKIKQKKAFVLVSGILEITFIHSIILIPLLLPKQTYVTVAIVMVVLGNCMVQLLSPTWSSWFATLVPSSIRARFISKRIIIGTLIAIVFGYLAGRFLDFFPQERKFYAFVPLFIIGFVTGIGGYLMAARAAFPPMKPAPSHSFLKSLFLPLQHRDFKCLLMFYGMWNFGAALANPFYNLYLIKTLQIPFSTIAIFNNISLITMIIGYNLWGKFVDRYGCKPVLQILMVPRIMIPLLWAFTVKSTFYFILPLNMIIQGVTYSGLTVALSPLLYDTVPEGQEKANFFAVWSFSVNIIVAIAAALSGMLARQFESVHLNIVGFDFTHLQIVFLIAGGVIVIANYLLRFVADTKAVPPGKVFDILLRGNPFAFAYNLFLFDHAEKEGKKGEAAFALGRSRNPLAVERLIDALEDVSYEVRSQAALGLGEAKDQEAVEPLVRFLVDAESDIRTEAAEALGKIGSSRVIEPLFKALQDEDKSVQVSAIRALSEIGGDEVRERLFWLFWEESDRMVFPTLVEALSRMGDTRIIKPTLERFQNYKSEVIKMQLLNSVCRSLGDDSSFFKLLSSEELERTSQIIKLLERAKKNFFSTKLLSSNSRDKILMIFKSILIAFQQERYEDMMRSIEEITEFLKTLRDHELSNRRLGDRKALALDSAILAIRTFRQLEQSGYRMPYREIFLTVCFVRVVTSLGSESKRINILK